MSENSPHTRELFSMYCRLHSIVGFDRERERAARILETRSDGRNCICILPVLEDGEHYYAQCNFKRSAEDSWDFKFLNTLKLICDQQVLPTLGREHAVEAYLFLDRETLNAFASQPSLRALSRSSR